MKYTALKGDLIGSRSLQNRYEIQQELIELTDVLNKNYAKELVSQFVVLEGDDFQAMFLSPSLLPEITEFICLNFRSAKMRFGVGCGAIDTKIHSVAFGMDGPTWHRAKEAIELATESKRSVAIYRGFGEASDQSLNAMSCSLEFQRRALTAFQVELFSHALKGLSQSEIATLTGKKRQQVNRTWINSGVDVWLNTIAAMKNILKIAETRV